MQRLADSHAPEFLEIDITMPQAKLLYLLGASGDLHMSDIVARLGVSLSTVSGLVDRVVDHGLATRREDRADRRQVVVALTPRAPSSSTASASSTRARCASCSPSSTTPTWPACGTPSRRSSGPRSALPHPTGPLRARPVHPAKGSRMSRLSEFAVAKRSVTLLLAGAVFIAGLLAWGSLKQELLPDIEFPVITVIAPLPGAGAADVAEQVTKPIERAISGVPRLEGLQSTSANSLSLVVAQFSFGSDVKEIRATIEQNLQNAGLPPDGEPAGQRPQHQLVAGDHRVDRRHVRGRADQGGGDHQGGDRARAARHRGRRQRRRHRWRGAAGPDHARPGQAHGERDLGRPGHGRARGQQPDLPVRPDHDRDGQDPGLHDRPHRRRRGDRGDGGRRGQHRAVPGRRCPDRRGRRARRPAGRVGPRRPPRPRRTLRPRPSCPRRPPRRSPSATSAPSSSPASRRPAMRARTASRPSPCRSPRRRTPTPCPSPTRSRRRSTSSARSTPTT